MERKLSREEEIARFELLPDAIKEVLLSPDTADSVVEIGEKYNLTGAQVEELVDTVVWTLYGVLPLEDFQKQLEVELQMTYEQTGGIAEDINEQIFLPIQEYLKQIQPQEGAAEGERKQREMRHLSNIRPAIESVEIGEAISEISKKYHLHVDVLRLLEEEINSVILGHKQASSLEENLRKQLQLPAEQARAVAKEVNDRIFLKIRESLKKTHSEKEKTPSSQEPHSATHSYVPSNLPTGDISVLKLKGALKIPKEEQEGSPPETGRASQADEREYKADPYREPLE